MKKNILNLEAVLFDMDGVLIDTELQYGNFWRMIAKRYNLYFEGFEKQIRGMTLKRLFEEPFKIIIDTEKDDVLKEFKIFENAMSFPEISGIASLLPLLKQSGIKLALVTSSDLEKVKRVILETKYDLYFDVMITANDIENGKPSPDCYLKAAEKLGITPENCIVFEDSFAGIAAAKSAKMVVVGVSSSHSKAELMCECQTVIADFKQVKLQDIAVFYQSSRSQIEN